MPRCSRYSESLAQFVADGEPRTSAYVTLRRHLVTCATCQNQVVRLRFIEETLRRYPRRAMDPALTRRILAAIAQEESARERARAIEGRLLTWDIWLPAVTLVMAVFILVLSIPDQMASFSTPLQIDPMLLLRPVSLAEFLPSTWLRGDDALFWALLSGFFAVASGIGLWMSLNAWSTDSTRGFTQIEGQVSGLVQRLVGSVRQAD